MPSLPSIDIDPLIAAAAVMVATACTDAVYVMFTNAVVKRRRLPAASWSSIWYMHLLLRRHQLHPSLGLCAVRCRRLVHRRLCDHDLPASRPGLSHAAARFCGRLRATLARTPKLSPQRIARGIHQCAIASLHEREARDAGRQAAASYF